ncbi:Adenylate and Guanylate cyclase catalytic domain [Carpediemonas membranifera]|uniref:Adenylate and Guanylate cyclase catalytic domain n=1 Tax=Carpediemonas membranifera TaxID=201153 RepID=A0A8J6ARL1_9EUKA|nr:Adenylate and Guanylate cyclase catalytic domain [Carpediemonas membranifera]|eukprot:KAG9392188.1 Adenylate and Guanylate cyclase catalytic domain [Carpediemonas membranifera]
MQPPHPPPISSSVSFDLKSGSFGDEEDNTVATVSAATTVRSLRVSPTRSSKLAVLDSTAALRQKITSQVEGLNSGLQSLVDILNKHRQRDPDVSHILLRIHDHAMCVEYAKKWGSPAWWRLVLGLYSISLLQLFVACFTDQYSVNLPYWLLSLSHMLVVASCHACLLFPAVRTHLGSFILILSCMAYWIDTIFSIIFAGLGLVPLISVPFHIIDLMFYCLAVTVPFFEQLAGNVIITLTMISSWAISLGFSFVDKTSLMNAIPAMLVVAVFQCSTLAVTYSVERRKKLAFINGTLAQELGGITDSVLRSLVPFHGTTKIMDGSASEHHAVATVGVINLDVLMHNNHPTMMVRYLEAAMVALDQLALDMGVEKINTFGTTYMVATVGDRAPQRVSSFIIAAGTIIGSATRVGSTTWRGAVASGAMQLGVVGQTAAHVEVLGPAVSLTMLLLKQAIPGTVASTSDFECELCNAADMGELEAKNPAFKGTKWVRRTPIPAATRLLIRRLMEANPKLEDAVGEIKLSSPVTTPSYLTDMLHISTDGSVADGAESGNSTDQARASGSVWAGGQENSFQQFLNGTSPIDIPKPDMTFSFLKSRDCDSDGSRAHARTWSSSTAALERLGTVDSSGNDVNSSSPMAITVLPEKTENTDSLSDTTPTESESPGTLTDHEPYSTAQSPDSPDSPDLDVSDSFDPSFAVFQGLLDITSDQDSLDDEDNDSFPAPSVPGRDDSMEDAEGLDELRLNQVRFNLQSSTHLEMTEITEMSSGSYTVQSISRPTSRQVTPRRVKGSSNTSSKQSVVPPSDPKAQKLASLTASVSSSLSAGLSTQYSSDTPVFPQAKPLPPVLHVGVYNSGGPVLPPLPLGRRGRSQASSPGFESRSMEHSFSRTSVEDEDTVLCGARNVVTNVAHVAHSPRRRSTVKESSFTSPFASPRDDTAPRSCQSQTSVGGTGGLKSGTNSSSTMGSLGHESRARHVIADVRELMSLTDSTRRAKAEAEARQSPRALLTVRAGKALAWAFDGVPLALSDKEFLNYWHRDSLVSHTGAVVFSLILLLAHTIVGLSVPLYSFDVLSKAESGAAYWPYVIHIAGSCLIVLEMTTKIVFITRTHSLRSSAFVALANTAMLNLFVITIMLQYFLAIAYDDAKPNTVPIAVYLVAVALFIQYSSIVPAVGCSVLRISMTASLVTFLAELTVLCLLGLTAPLDHWYLPPLLIFIPLLASLNRGGGGTSEALRTLHIRRVNRINDLISAIFPDHLLDRIFDKDPALTGASSSHTGSDFLRHSSMSLYGRSSNAVSSFDAVNACTVTIVDFASFSSVIEMTNGDLSFKILNYIIDMTDRRAEEFGLVKIKTMGDRAMYVSGLFDGETNHALLSCRAAIAILRDIEAFNATDLPSLKLAARVGIASGSAFGSVFGSYRFSYDVLGSAVTKATQLEGLCDVGSVYISTSTAMQLGSRFNLQKAERGFLLSL